MADDPHETSAEARAARRLLSAAAVRERAHQILGHAAEGRLDHFTVALDQLETCADEVVATIRARYPSLDVPFHARWRHFSVGGIDRWAVLAESVPWRDAAAMARAAFDLAIVSVLLDAGAGPQWRYREGRTGETYTRSEGLAVASFDMFIGGSFSSRPDDPYRVDADALMRLGTEELAQAFQVAPGNPLVGLEGRVRLLNRLGQVLAADAQTSAGDGPRPGTLFDLVSADAVDGRVRAPAILRALLSRLGAIWPGRISLGGIDLGDTWEHPLARAADATSGLVPFHKLSQWLSYSLIEPLQWAGFTVIDIDELTGLPEYRNGGLFLDSGVLRLKDPSDAGRRHEVGSRLVVEWRALTVALLDRIAPLIRTRLGLSQSDFPLSKVLEGGTWATGRRLAAARRPDGTPPLAVNSDGTVF